MRSHGSSSRQSRQQPNTPLGRYWQKTHRPLNMLVFLLPFIAGYEAGVSLLGTDLLARHQLGHFLAQLGASAKYLPALLVVVVLLFWHISLRQKWKVDSGSVAMMFFESLLWALPLLGLGLVGQRVMMAAREIPLLAGFEISRDLLAGIGGGIYEEFLFRLVGLNLVTLILVDVIELPRDWGNLIAVMVCAGLFSLYHFMGSRTITASAFAFYAAAGVYLGGIFLMRGLGVAVGAHVFYNVMVIWMQ